MQNLKWGIRMEGVAEQFQVIIIDYVKNLKSDNFRYFEVGVAGALTLNSIYKTVKSNIKISNWRVDGLDLPNGWSLDQGQIDSFKELNVLSDGSLKHSGTDNRTSLFLESDPYKFAADLPDKSIDICFIDADHCTFHVTKDFLAYENKIKNGGLVFFHDSCLWSQNTDPQGCGLGPIGVRQALVNLGLFDNTRSGWNRIGEILGDRCVGGNGNGMFVSKKS